MLLALPAMAQYTLESQTDHHEASGVRYFGSARDDRGVFLADVSFILDSAQGSFVFLTDASGRFRGNLPLGTLSQEVTARCWKPGLKTVRLTRRKGPGSGAPSVQLDCTLRPAR
jgi:hypothetical protein